MMPTTLASVARAMVDRTPNGRRDSELRVYMRSEYNGGDSRALAANARAGRATPVVRRAGPAARVSRALAGLADAVSSAFRQPSGS